ncbi:16S rRNA (uracil(1498)-N(3))-methyltransferase [Desulfonatronum thioautotrophicum]|uniref:16S rRNA (uracil(1498)-N(3))-methyltransferase n=1 Tax=Desulfonatronum thioautotrophicum TaxID=617001 RepID=UPI0005EB3498|nr:16S rRNA (uracil(1498)-N(3))-methyltransferase [Desulfonatronum thioautotrophicum]
MKSIYLPPEQWHEPFELTGPEVHHLVTVLRAEPGMVLRLFDGRGRAGTFVLQSTTRKTARMEQLSEEQFPRPSREIYLAMGWNKAARRGWILEKSVELGAAGLLFWQARHSQGHVPEQPKDSWTTHLTTAAKQCGASWLPTLKTVPEGPSGIERQFSQDARKYLLWENVSTRNFFDPATLPDTGRTVLVLGPEGGLAEDEARYFTENGYQPCSLGRSILRWETAALLCLGLCYWQGQRFGPDA